MRDDTGMLFREESESIIGAAMKVMNALKPGLKEKAYENALAIELRKRDHRLDQQREFDVFYERIRVDSMVPDLIVDERVIVDPKVVTGFTDTHMSTMIGYLAITGLRLAIIINFKYSDLRWKRVVR